MVIHSTGRIGCEHYLAVGSLVASKFGIIMDSSASAAGAAAADPSDNDDPSNSIPQEIPFLVTHWLANYGRGASSSSMTTTHARSVVAPLGDNDDENRRRQEALTTIRRATSEIASAFASLGAYGTTLRVRWSLAGWLAGCRLSCLRH